MNITINYKNATFTFDDCHYTIIVHPNETSIFIEDAPEPEPDISINGNPLIPKLGFGTNDEQ